jgi:hypothetical protein
MADEEFITPKDLSERTRRRLRWLLEKRVIASPKRRSRGLHKGTKTLYPKATIRCVEEFAARGRHSEDEWAFHLWIGDIPVVEIGRRLVKHFDRLQGPDIVKVVINRGVLDELLINSAEKGKKRRLELPRDHPAAPVFNDVRNKAARHNFVMALASKAFDLPSAPSEKGQGDWEIIKRRFALSAGMPEPPRWLIGWLANQLPRLRETLLKFAEAERAGLGGDIVAAAEFARRVIAVAGAVDLVEEQSPLLFKVVSRLWRRMECRAFIVAFLMRAFDDAAAGMTQATELIAQTVP